MKIYYTWRSALLITFILPTKSMQNYIIAFRQETFFSRVAKFALSWHFNNSLVTELCSYNVITVSLLTSL